MLLVLTLSLKDAAAQTGIHRCVQADGTIAFQEMPCPGPVDDGSDDSPDEATESAPPEALPDDLPEIDGVAAISDDDETDSGMSLPNADEACVQSTRDAIDAIDAEMREGFSEEEGDRYLAELLELTRQLRACKGP